MAEQEQATYFEITIPATFTIRVSPDELTFDEGETVDQALLAYIADVVENFSRRDSEIDDTEIDQFHIQVDEYQPPMPKVNPLPQHVGETRIVKVAQEKITYAWGTVWAHVGRFVEKPEGGA